MMDMRNSKKCENKVKLFDTYGVLYVGASEFIFDLDDLPVVEGRTWYEDKDGYLVSYYFYAGKRRCLRFHRIIMKAQPHQHIDHINRKKFDNRKKNLRCCKRIENDRNRSVYSNNNSGVTGVHYDKRRKRWVASITYNNKRIFIGRFYSKEDAIKARLEREIMLFGEFAPQKELWKEMYQNE